MTTPNATVTERKAFLLEWPCADGECASTFALNLICSTAYANQRKTQPPPDANGWVGGYCPDHQSPSGGG